MIIQVVLQEGIQKLKENKIKNAILKAKIVLAYLLEMTKEQLMIHDKEEIEEPKEEAYRQAIQEIVEGKPLQYITHHQEFMKLDFYVDEKVLIPRADTEILVEEVILLCQRGNQYRILDLCTGSGAIGIALATHIENSEIIQTDISTDAIQIAKRNAKQNQVEEKIQWITSNMFEHVEGLFDVIVSNPPYIRTAIIQTLDEEVRREPTIALEGGRTGLEFYHIIANQAYQYLTKEGVLCLEIGYDQKEPVIKLLEETGKYKEIKSKRDLYGNDRIVVAKVR